MIKRVKYISVFNASISHSEIVDIAFASAAKNEKLDITGILVAAGGLFFQVLEGPKEHVDTLYGQILQDERHDQVVTLKMQEGNLKRLFPEWRMELLDLNEEADERLVPIKTLVKAAHAQGKLAMELTETISAAAWSELKGR